jgi:3-oxoacyl-[acyl-carrier-protein] synthase-3
MLQTMEHVDIKGICSAVPSNHRCSVHEYTKMGESFVKKNSQAVGVMKRHIAPGSMCASDLACAAIEKLLDSLDWEKQTIDVLIFISQTPDYIIPNTSSVLHHRLKFSQHTIVFDMNLGCSGFIYGLWLISTLMRNGGLKRGLLITADTISKVINQENYELQLLFGDAASATALEHNGDDKRYLDYFSLGNDGCGLNSIMIPQGLFREIHFNDDIPAAIKTSFTGNLNTLRIDGPELMSFVLAEIPKMTQALMQYAQVNISHIDYWVMHQANQLVISSLATKMQVSLDKMLLSLGEFGNTSSASIPLTICHHASKEMFHNKLVMLIGFGVGYSWGAALIALSHVELPPIIYLD